MIQLNLKRKKKWYKLVWEKIYQYFQKIVNFFKTIIQKIIGLFKRKEVEKVEDELNNATLEQENEIEKKLDQEDIEIPEGKEFLDLDEVDSILGIKTRAISDRSKLIQNYLDGILSGKINPKKTPYPEYIKKTLSIDDNIQKKKIKGKSKFKKIFKRKTKAFMAKAKEVPKKMNDLSIKIGVTYKMIEQKYGQKIDKLVGSAADEIKMSYTTILKDLSKLGSECSTMMSNMAYQIQFMTNKISDSVKSVLHKDKTLKE